jgi:large subunit ribosomal protein L18e
MKTNQPVIKLIEDLKAKASQEKISLFRRLAIDLEKSSSNQRVVNLSRLSRYTKEGDFVVVPGKVLGGGDLSHKLTVAALKFSGSSEKKIKDLDGKCMSMTDLMKEGIQGKKIKIIG